MENLPDLVLLQIFKHLPRRVLEDAVINVCRRWEDLAIDILSERVTVTEFCKLPPGFDSEIDLSITRELIISSGWTCRWWDYECEGLKRNYFEQMLNNLNPAYLHTLRSPIRNKEQLEIIMKLNKLRYLSLDILKPNLGIKAIQQVTQLSNLQFLHLDGAQMTTGDFAQIAQSCRFLTGFSFPLRTPWAEPGWLSVLAATKIRKIRPWSYIGGYDEYKIEGQCFELMFKVLEQMPDLSDIELHLVALSQEAAGQEEEKRQEALLPRLIRELSMQKNLKRFSLYHTAEKNHMNISAINLTELVMNFAQLEEFSISSKLEDYSSFEIATFYRSLAELPKLTSLMLNDVPLVDGLQRAFGESLEKLMLLRPTKLGNEESMAVLEETVGSIGALKRLHCLRISVLSMGFFIFSVCLI